MPQRQPPSRFAIVMALINADNSGTVAGYVVQESLSNFQPDAKSLETGCNRSPEVVHNPGRRHAPLFCQPLRKPLVETQLHLAEATRHRATRPLEHERRALEPPNSVEYLDSLRCQQDSVRSAVLGPLFGRFHARPGRSNSSQRIPATSPRRCPVNISSLMIDRHGSPTRPRRTRGSPVRHLTVRAHAHSHATAEVSQSRGFPSVRRVSLPTSSRLVQQREVG